MFPDLDEDNIGGAVGIIIPDTISQSDREIFESILTEITTAFKTQVGSAPDPEAHEIGLLYVRKRWRQSMQGIRSSPAPWPQGW